MSVKIVVLHDLCFESQYFHSASLRVMMTPGTEELDVSLVITLFVHNGMRDFGAKGSTILETVRMFGEIVLKTSDEPLGDAAIAEITSQKTIELQYYRKALAAKRDAVPIPGNSA